MSWAIARGTVKPALDESLPLERAAEAHLRLEAGSALGRITLAVAA
ncbi:MAG: zinc-binding dehydrogenase [Acetobacteraceae bacterium]|nr:zinc-binding dehydrogenase [Acetobacteraceae bacterium]